MAIKYEKIKHKKKMLHYHNSKLKNRNKVLRYKLIHKKMKPQAHHTLDALAQAALEFSESGDN